MKGDRFSLPFERQRVGGGHPFSNLFVLMASLSVDTLCLLTFRLILPSLIPVLSFADQFSLSVNLMDEVREL